MNMMRAARLHQIGMELSIEEIAKPEPRPNDVLVQVKACGVIPNMKNVMNCITIMSASDFRQGQPAPESVDLPLRHRVHGHWSINRCARIAAIDILL
jgi:hypothetical protein